MRIAKIERLNTKHRTRQLGSDERVGRYSRDLLWEQINSFFRLNWKILLALVVAPTVFAIPGLVFMKGAEFWIVIGAAGISGPWLASIVVILWGGVATTLMGLEGETLTADFLRSFRSKGWFLLNGMKIKGKADIDHVLVGPAGIIVFETKWSHEQWPMGDKSKQFMFDRLAGAVAQVNRNRSDIKWRFGKTINEATVRAVCVLWSSEGFAGDDEWYDYRGVTVVRGHSLTKWIDTLQAGVLDQSTIDRISGEFEKQALSRDEVDLDYSAAPRPTIHKLFARAIVDPLLGFLFPFYLMVAVAHLNALWADIVGMIIVLIAGLIALRVDYLKRSAQGWLGAFGLWCVIMGVALIQVFTR